MTLRPSAAALQLGQRRRRGARVAGGAVRLQARDLLGSARRVDREEAAVLAGGERRGRALGEAVDADHLLLAGLDRGEAAALLSTRRCFM